jgi:hypothetical protein
VQPPLSPKANHADWRDSTFGHRLNNIVAKTSTQHARFLARCNIRRSLALTVSRFLTQLLDGA